MKKLFLSILLLSAFQLAAQQGKETTSKHGYRIITRADMGQPKAKFMDEIMVHVGVYIGDSLMQSSRVFAPTGFKAPMPSEDEFNNTPSAPVLVDAGLMMGVGDSLTAFMRIDSFIRTTLPPSLRKFNEVRYEIKMISLVSGETKRLEREKAMAAFSEISKKVGTTVADYRNGTLRNVIGKPSGLKYLVVEPGKGAPVQKGENIACHYYGSLTNGTMFDNSFERGEPLEFGAGTGQMIAGFDEGVLGLNHGAKAYLFMPPSLGYGDQASGPVPANAELIFYIEIQ